jgi:two-component system response regulator AtoC
MGSMKGSPSATSPGGAPAPGPAPRDGDTLLVIGCGLLVPFAIDRDEVVIGRAEDCDVVLDHQHFSRRHAVLRRSPGWSITDLGSTNGTRVGREARVGGGPVALEAGESFYIGPYTFVIMSSGARHASSARDARDRLQVDDPSPEKVSPLVREIARSDVNVLILGETGAGKEVLAATLHALSGRRGRLARVNCAALAESLLESELFGHEKGAFTGATAAKPGLFETAVGGTVLLDEIGELPLGVQAKLLRAVESREVFRVGATRPTPIDARLLAATNRDLAAEVAAQRFRQDLFYRLDGVTLRLPPLRERKGQIALLALGFARACEARGGRALTLRPDFLAALEAYDWPGNVRELKAAIERAALLSRDGVLHPRHLSLSGTPPPPPAAVEPDGEAWTPEQRAERAGILEALDACAGNQTRAARRLGISRSTMVTKLTLYRIARPRRP